MNIKIQIEYKNKNIERIFGALVDVLAGDAIGEVVSVAEARHAEVVRRNRIIFGLTAVESLSHAVIDQPSWALILLPYC